MNFTLIGNQIHRLFTDKLSKFFVFEVNKMNLNIVLTYVNLCDTIYIDIRQYIMEAGHGKGNITKTRFNLSAME